MVDRSKRQKNLKITNMRILLDVMHTHTIIRGVPRNKMLKLSALMHVKFVLQIHNLEIFYLILDLPILNP